jgi:hypothetical protein
MKTFNQYLTENTWFGNPNDDVSKYVTGLKNRLSLLRPEEIDNIRKDLEELDDIIQNVLKRA